MTAIKNIPEELLINYSMNNSVEIAHMYFDNTEIDKSKIYTSIEIDAYINRANNKETYYYGNTDKWLYEALEKYQIKNKKIAIFGSTIPWYESICLSYGCEKCFIIEYNHIVTEKKELEYINCFDNKLGSIDIDFGMSISSFEHDGLGRYGDPLDPDGDIKAMEKCKSIIKHNGLLFLSVPVGKDKVVWNAHRVYGEKRLPLLLSKWEVVESFGFEERLMNVDNGNDAGYQPIFVLKNR